MAPKFQMIFLMIFFLMTGCVQHEDKIDFDKMLWAIKKSEGKFHPYGIKGCKNEEICRNSSFKTIKHLYRKFNGKTIRDFIRFASRRYVDSHDRKGQENWYRNVTYFYFEREKYAELLR
jgi:hypothetical protein